MVRTETEVKDIINKYISYLSKEMRIKRVILYGSYATGKASEESDIDLAIESPDFSDNYVDDWKRLYRSVWRSGVDPIVEPRPIHPKMQQFINEEIIKNGKIVYESDLN